MCTGERIRYLRIKNNLTSKELSRALEISESSISLYENGKRQPNITLLIKIANYFNVTTDFLLGIESCVNDTKASVTDFSKTLQNVITLLNCNEYIIFDGVDLDNKTVSILKNNLNCLLENMRMMIN